MAFVTTKGTEDVFEPRVAVIVAPPAETPETNPAVVTEAMVGFEEAHVTLVVRLWVLPSLKVPVAVN